MGVFSKAEGAGSSRAPRGARDGAGGGQSLLAENCRIDGVARFEGPLRIDGVFEGSIDVGDTLVVGKPGSFTGEIRARSVVVCGTVRGSIAASHSVELQRGARVEGDVQTRIFVVEEGVFFQGNCRMEEADEEGDALRVPKLRPASALPEGPRFESQGDVSIASGGAGPAASRG